MSISHIKYRYINTLKKILISIGPFLKISNIDKDIIENNDIEKDILKNIDIDKDILENIDIDIDMGISENIDIDIYIDKGIFRKKSIFSVESRAFSCF